MEADRTKKKRKQRSDKILGEMQFSKRRSEKKKKKKI